MNQGSIVINEQHGCHETSKGRDKDMNMMKVEMQMGECLHQKQLVKETAGARVIRSKDSCVGREENSSP